MPEEKRYRAYVIFVRPEQHEGGSNYIANDGTVTGNKDNAAQFLTHGEALAFAKIRKITLNDVTRYIGQEDFTSREA
jgi:hypothetical protein